MSRVAIIGGKATMAVIGLRMLRDMGIAVPLVITGAEDDGIDDWRLSLANEARTTGYRDGESLLVTNNPNSNEVLSAVRSAGIDLLLSLQCRKILKHPLIETPLLGTVNVHNAPLPLLRGCDPFAWAIHDGLKTMGVTLHRIVDDGIDSGPMLARKTWDITDESTAWSLYNESLIFVSRLLSEQIAPLLRGELQEKPQQNEFVTYHPEGQFEFSRLQIDFEQPVAAVSAFIRSRVFPPFQLPYAMVGGIRIPVVGCRVLPGSGRAGAIISREPFVISAKRGHIQLYAKHTFG